MSGGQAQRVMIAMALSANPKLLIADEPTSHIDAESIKILFDILMDLKSKGKTIIVSSHDPVFLDYSETTFLLKMGS
jgi:ABC-type lipoprotein export system ATPase subunit